MNNDISLERGSRVEFDRMNILNITSISFDDNQRQIADGINIQQALTINGDNPYYLTTYYGYKSHFMKAFFFSGTYSVSHSNGRTTVKRR